jgi:hypothetical protein
MSNNTRPLKSIFTGLTAAAIISTTIVSSAPAKASLGVLTGAWQGEETMSFESGKAESISCNGYYKGGDTFSVVIRCKGTTSNFELRSKLTSSGDKVSGSWEERTYNASGDASGSASPGKLDVQFGGSLKGSLAMSFSSSSQSVAVSVDTKGAGIKGVRVSLNRV